MPRSSTKPRRPRRPRQAANGRAGSDTTSSALAATLFYLSRHRAAHAALAAELRAAFPTPAAIAAGPALRSCALLRGAVSEALRLSPPLSGAPWRVVRAGGALIDGQLVPAGTTVGACVYALHHGAAFAAPWRFAPERWIAGPGNPQSAVEEAARAWAPFLVGPRMCAARNMAMAELMLAVAHIVFCLEFRVAEGEEGRRGEGRLGMGVGRERDDEFQLYSHFVTVAKEGPVLQFRKRAD